MRDVIEIHDLLLRTIIGIHDWERKDRQVEKPGALRFARSVGVRILRTREDYHDETSPPPTS